MGEMSKKDLKDLMEEMRNMVQKAFGDDFYVSLETVKKNNGLTKNAVNIRQSDEPIASVIYIDQVLGLIKDGSTGLQDAVNEIVEMYEKQSTEITMNGAAGIMESLKKENILKKVVYRLINREKNLHMSLTGIFWIWRWYIVWRKIKLAVYNIPSCWMMPYATVLVSAWQSWRKPLSRIRRPGALLSRRWMT